jgi:glycogen debranching enzyme
MRCLPDRAEILYQTGDCAGFDRLIRMRRPLLSHGDADGLLAAGEPGVQLTWMDAKVGDWVRMDHSEDQKLSG